MFKCKENASKNYEAKTSKKMSQRSNFCGSSVENQFTLYTIIFNTIVTFPLKHYIPTKLISAAKLLKFYLKST